MAEHSLINTTFPVMLPEMPELRLPKSDFDAYIKSLLPDTTSSVYIRLKNDNTTAENKSVPRVATVAGDAPPSEAPFMTGLLANKATVPSLDDRDGKMLTENADVAYRDSGEVLVDLFFELEDVISADRLKSVLEKAWQHDPEATLKIIWNARSIHLGKSSRFAFYRAIGWLAEHHPLTLIVNLPWLVRPLIQKKAPKTEEKEDPEKPNKGDGDAQMVDIQDADSDFEIVDAGNEEPEGQPEQKKLKLDNDPTELSEFDVKYGVSHGYWKDLLNILALAANDQLKVDGKPRSVLNIDKPSEKKYKRDWTEGRKRTVNDERHSRVINKLQKDNFYKALHLTVVRLFVDQLQADMASLQSGQKARLENISLAAKWAPIHKGMHDQHTCVVSSIGELLHPFESCAKDIDPADRELYLKHARVAYQSKTLSPLRGHLNVVERDITAESFDQIKYDRVPSLAMAQYTSLFAKKDFDRFDKYIDSVASGKSRISGATLLPSTLVAATTAGDQGIFGGNVRKKTKGADVMVEKKLHDIKMKTIDGQWKTLVQRIKDSGTLESSIAVCDVSGSMSYPPFPDGTCPMDTSIGLSLLLAEVTKPPFGGAFITFSRDPHVMRVGGQDDTRSFGEKIKYIQSSNWSMNTDFVAVFEKLILPTAIENNLSQEDMVKQVFVFSDMQFDMASEGDDRWTTSYERIQKKFRGAGFEMPRLIFWNLAGGRAGHEMSDTDQASGGDETAPKPVTAAEKGTALVSGYSQGQLKMFLDNGSFEDPEEDESTVQVVEGIEDEVLVEKQEKQKQNPLDVVKKAIGHEAYRMLKVVD